MQLIRPVRRQAPPRQVRDGSSQEPGSWPRMHVSSVAPLGFEPRLSGSRHPALTTALSCRFMCPSSTPPPAPCQGENHGSPPAPACGGAGDPTDLAHQLCLLPVSPPPCPHSPRRQLPFLLGVPALLGPTPAALPYLACASIHSPNLRLKAPLGRPIFDRALPHASSLHLTMK